MQNYAGSTVVNLVSNPTNAAIAVSAWVLGDPGRPKLFDVNATVNVSSGLGYPLWVGQAVNIKVTGGNLSRGRHPFDGQHPVRPACGPLVSRASTPIPWSMSSATSFSTC